MPSIKCNASSRCLEEKQCGSTQFISTRWQQRMSQGFGEKKKKIGYSEIYMGSVTGTDYVLKRRKREKKHIS